MKKPTLYLLILSLVSTVVYAEPICSQNELARFMDNRFEESESGGIVAQSFYDTKTIKINKKNKLIDVWYYMILNESGRNQWTEIDPKFSNIGYKAFKYHIFYGTNQIKYTKIIDHACNHDILESETNPNTPLTDITPDSLSETLKNDIMSKYKLK